MRRLARRTLPVSLVILLAHPGAAAAQEAQSVALSGVVHSLAEGWMEGVVVTVRREGAPFTVSVVSDDQGRYSFPRPHLEPGAHDVTIRAAGYDWPRPAGSR